MRLKDLNWMDVERYLEHDSRIILITGATEQHAYLSLMTDILIPERIADVVTQRTNVLIAPPLNFGISQIFSEFPGTISFSQHTFNYAVTEIVESLFHQGFRRFFVLNGHNGNRIPPQLDDFQMGSEICVVWHDWWRGPAVQAFEEQHELKLDHANWGENFSFNRVAESPSEEKTPINLAYVEEQRYFSAREVMGDGCYGGLYQIDDELMLKLFDQVVDEVVELVEALRD
jgi:creatinine amidohydrolase